MHAVSLTNQHWSEETQGHHTSISQHLRYSWEVIGVTRSQCDLYSFRKHTNQHFEQIGWVAVSTTHSERQRFCSNTHTYLFTWAFSVLTTLFSPSVQVCMKTTSLCRTLGQTYCTSIVKMQFKFSQSFIHFGFQTWHFKIHF